MEAATYFDKINGQGNFSNCCKHCYRKRTSPYERIFESIKEEGRPDEPSTNKPHTPEGYVNI
jgi:hypothetical protein